METIRIWHRPNLPASSKISSKVVMVTVRLVVEDLKMSAAVKRGLLSWGTVFTHSCLSKSPEEVDIWYIRAAIDQLHAGMGHGGQVTF